MTCITPLTYMYTYIVHISSTTTSSPPPPHTPTTLSLLLLFFCHNNVNVLIYFFPKKIAFNPVTTILMIPTPNNKLNQKNNHKKTIFEKGICQKKYVSKTKKNNNIEKNRATWNNTRHTYPIIPPISDNKLNQVYFGWVCVFLFKKKEEQKNVEKKSCISMS